MEMNQEQNKEQMRERWIHRYVQALDRGDAESIEAVLEAALEDLELSEAIDNINLAYLEEVGVPAFSNAAQTVRELAQKHLASPAAQQERMAFVPTIGEVAAQLQVQRLVHPEDENINSRLLQNQRPIPLDLTTNNLLDLFAELGVHAGRRYVRAFKDTAIWLDMSRNHSQIKIAAREQNRRNR
jgi:hypothetical protein